MKINWVILSKYKSELYGFSILWIMLLHCPFLRKIDIGGFSHLIITFFRHGNIGVDIFLFLSGICLFFSMKQHDVIKDFYFKRCSRIFMPLFIIDGFYWLYDCVLVKHNVLLFLKKVTLLHFWLHGRSGDGIQVWFIALLVPLYFLYPFIYKKILLKTKSNHKSRWLVLLILFTIIYSIAFFWRYYYAKQYSAYEIAFTRIPVFLLGCCCGDFVYENKPVNKTILIFSFIGAILGILNFYFNFIGSSWWLPIGKYYRIPYLVCAPCIALWFCIILDRLKCFSINQILTLFGEVSLELYLTHILLRYFARDVNLYGNNNLFNVYKYLFFVLLASYTLSKIVNVLCKQVLQRKATS